MNDAGLVRGFERFRDLPRDRQHLVDRDRSARTALRERLAFHQLHHQRTRAARILDAVDVGDVRVIQRSERLRFALEAHHAIGVARERFRQ